MPVEVVGSDVQQDGDVRMQVLRRLELEAAQLGDEDCPGLDVVHGGNQGDADVAADERGKAGRLQHLAQERRSRGLAVRPGDADQPPGQEPARRLDFGDDLNPAGTRRLELRQVPGHSGADHDQVLAEEGLCAMEAEFEPHFERGQFGDDVLEDGGWPGIGDRHHGSPAAKAAGGGTTAPRQTHHQHALAAQFVHPILPDRRCPFLRKYPSRIPETVSERDRRARRASRRARSKVSRSRVRLTRVGLRNDLGLAIRRYCAFYAQKPPGSNAVPRPRASSHTRPRSNPSEQAGLT